MVYVPNAIAFSKRAPTYRYLAIRERLEQGVLEGMEGESSQRELPFATLVCGSRAYRLSGIVTNRAEEGEELIRWHYERCGKSEEAHAVMKSDLAGGRLPLGSRAKPRDQGQCGVVGDSGAGVQPTYGDAGSGSAGPADQ